MNKESVKQIIFNERVVFLVVLARCLSTSFSQTVNIETSTPIDGAIFELDCLIVHVDLTGNNAFQWSKDGRGIGWSQNGVISYLDATGSYKFEEYRENADVYHFKVIIHQFSGIYSGLYKCVLAEGTSENYLSIREASVHVSIGYVIQPTDMNAVTAATKRTVPSSESPTCFPNNDFNVLIYTNTTIKCVAKTSSENPILQMNLYASGHLVPTSKSTYDNVCEITQILNIMPEDHNTYYHCQVSRFLTGTSTCDFGSLQIQLFHDNTLDVMAESEAVFDCAAGLQTEIEWSTNSPIQPSRLLVNESQPNLLRITNVQMDDNNTVVTCKVLGLEAGTELKDQALLIVIPRTDMENEADTKLETTTFTPYQTNTNLVYIIAAAGGGFVVLILITICITACICCRKSNVADKMSEDNMPTRISTGYVWDRELSQKIHDSPMPSPRLSERNPHHASALQALQQPREEPSRSMSPTIAYALTHLSDDDNDSDTDTLKKPNTKSVDSYQTIGETAASNLDRDASVRSNLYTSVSKKAPNTPAPPPPAQNEDGPTYAMPEKACKDSRQTFSTPIYAKPDKKPKQNERVSIPEFNPLYAVVRADPENPVVRALSERLNGGVNSAYKPDEVKSKEK